MVSATTRSATEGSSFGMREGRVLSRKSPSTPSAAKRSCQRQTQVLDLPVSHMIAFVPAPLALSNTICARQTCFCGALRSLTRATSRSRSAGVTDMEMPGRMPQTRTPRVRQESPSGFKCQTRSTSVRILGPLSGAPASFSIIDFHVSLAVSEMPSMPVTIIGVGQTEWHATMLRTINRSISPTSSVQNCGPSPNLGTMKMNIRLRQRIEISHPSGPSYERKSTSATIFSALVTK